MSLNIAYLHSVYISLDDRGLVCSALVTVIEMRLELMEIFSNAFRLEFMRDTYTFYNRLE